jgi:plasmid stability protein
MANVLLRDVPEEVLNRLKDMAKAHNRSLQQELRVVLVESAAGQTLPNFFQKTSELRKQLRKKGIRFSDSAKLLRKDRLR